MDNQHKKINGYRELNQEEIDLMNEVKRLEAELLAAQQKVADHVARQRYYAADGDPLEENAETERLHAAEPERWLAIGKTHIQQGCSALVRAVAQPTT